MERTYAEYAARQAMELLAIDSPTGFTARAADWVQRAFEELGYTARHTAKGGNTQMPPIQRQMHTEKSAHKIDGKKSG